MSQFVDVDNQNLLWRMAHKIPEFQNIPSSQKDTFFKQTIQQVYDTISKPELTREELQTYNQNVLSHIVRQLRPPVPPITKPSNVRPQSQNQSSSFFVESKDELFQRQFQAKQQEYESMNAKPDIPDAAELFKEKIEDDERIENMDELLKQYESQREQDMKEVMSNTIPPSTAISENETNPEVLLKKEPSKNTLSENTKSKHFSNPEKNEKLQYFLDNYDLFVGIFDKIEDLNSRIVLLESSQSVSSTVEESSSSSPESK